MSGDSSTSMFAYGFSPETVRMNCGGRLSSVTTSARCGGKFLPILPGTGLDLCPDRVEPQRGFARLDFSEDQRGEDMAEVGKVGILTGGGDAPGLNGVIRAVTTKCVEDYGYEVVGLKRGWKSLLDPEPDTVMPLGVDDVRYILQEGGTILGSSRTNPYKNEGDAEKVVRQMEDFGVDALVAIGGDDTLGVAKRLYDDFGVQVVGCPKTIDNDLSATDTTFGYDTAVSIATDAIDKLRTTARSHERVV